MSQALACPQCGSLYQLTPEYVAQYGGQTTQCARCGASFTVPAQLAPLMADSPAGVPVAVLPYAGPAALSGLAGVWRDGNLLVASKGTLLPERCAKCNSPADGPPIRRKYSWHHPAIYLIILVQLIVYIIVALVVSERGIVYISLCERHR